MRALRWLGWAALCLALLAALALGWAWPRAQVVHATPTPTSPAEIQRGAYLARVGNCMGCHTARGGLPWAGGRGIATPFGTLYSGNLTPDADTGLGLWSTADFWRALHQGRSRDGRLLYPAFPYTHYTRVTRADADALFAYLQGLVPVRQASRTHALRFPYDSQLALAFWQALFFRPETFTPEPGQSVQWNRGAYLVQGLAHCGACHTPRNDWGGLREAQALAGGQVAGQGWYAPALDAAHEAGLQRWAGEDALALLKKGVAPQAGVSGPMAEVVFGSLQYLDDADLRAMLHYLQSLPERALAQAPGAPPTAAVLEQGRGLYAEHCAQCHGAQGEGRAGAYAALAGNRAVLLAEPMNLVQMVLHGGYAPATAGNPRPHGMPPFVQRLSNEEIAAVLSYMRSAWGNDAGRVDAMDVHRVRERGSPR